MLDVVGFRSHDSERETYGAFEVSLLRDTMILPLNSNCDVASSQMVASKVETRSEKRE